SIALPIWKKPWSGGRSPPHAACRAPAARGLSASQAAFRAHNPVRQAGGRRAGRGGAREGRPVAANDERGRGKRFAFGKNWASYAGLIDDRSIEESERGLLRLIPEGVGGRSFLDIGCGSGLHALAAARLGASRILAVDVDSDSVATA